MRSSAKMNCASCKYAFLNMFVVPCCNCNEGSEFKPKTNADHIRSMTDEELARMLAIGCHETRECPTIWNPIYPYDEVVESCEKCWFEWLKEESE